MTAAPEHNQADEQLDDDLLGIESLVGRELLGRYRLDQLLSVGGTGAVYRGHQITLKRNVAVKILHPQLTRNERIFKRFRREAESTARFEHPNIVQVLEAGSTDDGYHFIVMQLLDGVELHEALGAPFAPRRAAELMLQTFCGIEHAHQRGVVHRDIKPENVFLVHDHEGRETVKLVDFGLAKLVEGADDGETLTKLGMVFGTPAYMSPEQATGREVDQRTDLYSTGLIFYGMLAGRPPFIEDDAVALMRAQVKEMPPPLPDDVPPELAELVFQLLAKNPDDRPADATAVRARLEELIPSLPQAFERGRRALPIPMWLKVAAVAVVVGGLTFATVAIVGGNGHGAEDQASTGAAARAAADVKDQGAEDASPTTTTSPSSPEVAGEGPIPGKGPDPSAKPDPPPPSADTNVGETSPPKSSTSKKSKPKSKSTAKKKRGFKLGEMRRPGGK